MTGSTDTYCRAGKMWAGVCNIRSSTKVTQGGTVVDRTCTEINSITYTVPRFSLYFSNMPGGAAGVDDGSVSDSRLVLIAS